MRATLKTHDGAFVYVEYTGRLDVEAGLVAAAPTFETGAEEYAWLNSIQAVSAGEVDMASGQLIYQIYEARPLAGD